MRVYIFIPTLILAFFSLGRARPVEIAVDKYFWTVTDFVAATSTKDLTVGEYSFTVFGPYDGSHPNVGQGMSSIPAFTQLCKGTAKGTPLSSTWNACEAQGAAAEKSNFSARVASQASETRIYLSYVFESRDYSGPLKMYNITSWNSTKDWTVKRLPEQFMIDERHFALGRNA